MKNIEINIKTSTGYEVLYPNIQANNVVDFSGDNPLLSESTASLFGLGSGAIPDQVFQKIGQGPKYEILNFIVADTRNIQFILYPQDVIGKKIFIIIDRPLDAIEVGYPFSVSLNGYDEIDQCIFLGDGTAYARTFNNDYNSGQSRIDLNFGVGKNKNNYYFESCSFFSQQGGSYSAPNNSGLWIYSNRSAGIEYSNLCKITINSVVTGTKFFLMSETFGGLE